MLHALMLGCAVTLVFAALYALLGWANGRVSHHYYEIANHPELDTPAKTVAAWLLRAVLIYALLGWIAEIANLARTVVHTWSAPMALLGHALCLFIACFAIMLIVWGAFKLQSEFTAISPEFMIAIALCSYEIFAIFPRTHFLWRWLPGLA
jgi:hypothetical protein